MRTAIKRGPNYTDVYEFARSSSGEGLEEQVDGMFASLRDPKSMQFERIFVRNAKVMAAVQKRHVEFYAEQRVDEPIAAYVIAPSCDDSVASMIGMGVKSKSLYNKFF